MSSKLVKASVSGGGGIADPGSNGILARTALNTASARTITGTTNQVTVTNGDGVSGNPTLSLPQNIDTSATPTFSSLTAGTATDVLGTALSVIRNNVAVGRIDNNASGLRVQAQNGSLQLRGTGNTGIAIDASGNAVVAGTITGANLSGTNTGDQPLGSRTITGTTNQITVTNGNGVSGNPTLSLPSAITTPGTLTTTGVLSPSADSTYTLGTSSLYWSNTYTDRLYLNSTAYLDGSTTGVSNLTGRLFVSESNALNTAAPDTYAFTTAQAGGRIALGSNASGNYIQSFGTRPLVFNLAGNNSIFYGNVGIGTTAPNEKLTVAGAISITDGITAPSATSGYAKIYVDTADGDLKVIFGDGTVKTIATDT